MRTFLCCLPLLVFGVAGCVLPGKAPEPPVPAVKPEPVAKTTRPPAPRAVLDKDINETNAWEKAKALREELDRDQQPEDMP